MGAGCGFAMFASCYEKSEVVCSSIDITGDAIRGGGV